MRKACTRLLALIIIGLLACAAVAQELPAGENVSRPDVKAVTMDQLLEEFHHPPEGEMTLPAPQRHVR